MAGLEPPPPALVDAALKRNAAARACIQGRSPALVDAALKRNAAARACIQAHNTALVDAALERRAATRACIHARGKSPADAQRPAARGFKRLRPTGQAAAVVVREARAKKRSSRLGEASTRRGGGGVALRGGESPPSRRAPGPRAPPPHLGSPRGASLSPKYGSGAPPASRVASLCAAARSSSGRAGPDGLRPRRGYPQSARVTPPKNSPHRAVCSPLWRPAAALLCPRFHSIVAAACPVCLSRWPTAHI